MTWVGDGQRPVLGVDAEVLFSLSGELPVLDVTMGEEVGVNVRNLLLHLLLHEGLCVGPLNCLNTCPRLLTLEAICHSVYPCLSQKHVE